MLLHPNIAHLKALSYPLGVLVQRLSVSECGAREQGGKKGKRSRPHPYFKTEAISVGAGRARSQTISRDRGDGQRHWTLNGIVAVLTN